MTTLEDRRTPVTTGESNSQIAPAANCSVLASANAGANANRLAALRTLDELQGKLRVRAAAPGAFPLLELADELADSLATLIAAECAYAEELRLGVARDSDRDMLISMSARLQTAAKKLDATLDATPDAALAVAFGAEASTGAE